MSTIQNSAAVELKLQSFRGYSAYEIAVQNGFSGTQQQWLQSLHGRDGADAGALTVNNVAPVDGNIILRGTDICLQPGMAVTLKQALDQKLTPEMLSDELNASPVVQKKAEVTAQEVLLPAGQWEMSESGWTQSAPFANTGAHLILSPAPESLALCAKCGVYALQQTEEGLLFQARTCPQQDVTLQVLCVYEGREVEA